MSSAVPQKADPPVPHAYNLRKGGQAIINGALVTAIHDCHFMVSAGASVIGGRLLFRRGDAPKPAHELYYATLDAAGSQSALDEAYPRLLVLLAETVAFHRTHKGQAFCSAYAAGLATRDVDAILAAARGLAAGEAGSKPD